MSKTKSRPVPAIKITLPVLEQLIAKQAEVQAAMTADHVLNGIRKLAADAGGQAERAKQQDRQAFETSAQHYGRNDPKSEQAAQWVPDKHVPEYVRRNGFAARTGMGAGIGSASMPGHTPPTGGWAEQARPLPPPGNPPPMPRVVDAIEEFNRTVNTLEELPQMFRSALVGVLPPDFEIPSVPTSTVPTTSPNVAAIYMLTRRVENIQSQLKIVLSALTL